MEEIYAIIIKTKDFLIHYHIHIHLILALIAAIVIETFLKPFRHWREKRKALKEHYTFTGKSSSLTPDKVWEGIRLGKYNEYYYPRPAEDGLINDCLKNKKNVLITGPPLSGKTRAAYQALKKKLNKPQKVAIPRCTDIKTEDFLPPKTSIIFINDLHEFVDKQNFERLWNTATDVKNNVTIIATCQSAEMKKVENKIKDLGGIFESIIELPRISEAVAREIANEVGIDWKDVEFDRTIGSVFLRLDEMRRRFNKYEEEAPPQRVILQALRSLYMCGIYEEKQVFPLKWIKITTEKVGFKGNDFEWDGWLRDLKDKEFITFAEGDRVRAEETHLEVVVKPPDRGEILDVSEDTIAAFSDEPEALFRLGNRAYSIGITGLKKERYIEIAIKAYNTCEEALKEVSTLRDRLKGYVYNNRGNAYKGKGDYDRAISDFNKALKINPRFAVAYYNRGNTYAQGKGDYDQAISDFNEALKINPRYAEVYYNRGLAYYGKGDYDRAISDFNEAVNINPMYADAYNNRAVAYYAKREYGKAWDDVHKAQGLGYQIHPGFLEALREASGRE